MENDIHYLLIVGIMLLLLATVYILYMYRYTNNYLEYRACVINLARRRDRMIQFGKHYTLPVRYEIVDAVDGLTLEPYHLYDIGILGDAGMQSLINSSHGISKRYHYELGSVGAIGCSLSHIKIWEKIVKENIKYMFVFEDDAWVMSINMDDIINRLADLPEDWHMYMIGQPHSILEGLPVKGKHELYRLTRFCGTHGYIINYEGARWLLEKGMLYPIQQQIDAHLSEVAWDHNFNIYMHLNKPMYGVFSAFSDIQVRSDKSTWERFRLEPKSTSYEQSELPSLRTPPS